MASPSSKTSADEAVAGSCDECGNHSCMLTTTSRGPRLCLGCFLVFSLCHHLPIFAEAAHQIATRKEIHQTVRVQHEVAPDQTSDGEKTPLPQ